MTVKFYFILGERRGEGSRNARIVTVGKVEDGFSVHHQFWATGASSASKLRQNITCAPHRFLVVFVWLTRGRCGPDPR